MNRNMNRWKGMQRLVWGSMSLLFGFVYPTLGAAQAVHQPPSIHSHEDPVLRPLSAGEAQQARQALQRTHPTGSQRVETVLVENMVPRDKDEAPGVRRAHVVTYNYDTNETSSAVIALSPRERIEHLDVSRRPPPFLASQELERAKGLALSHPGVRSRLAAAGIDPGRQDLIITHLLAQGAMPDHPCSIQRCVLLNINTPDAVLEPNVLVNLTTGNVEVR
jgi:hypothetical protein